jgi:hypothetical protein
MFVTLYAILCLNAAIEGTCKRELVSDTHLAEDITFYGCLGHEGQVSAMKFKEAHPLYRTWHLKGWACSWGNQPRKTDNRA